MTTRRSFLRQLAVLGTGIVVVPATFLAEVQRQVPVQDLYRRIALDNMVEDRMVECDFAAVVEGMFDDLWNAWASMEAG